MFPWLYESVAQCLSLLTNFRHRIEQWTKPEHIASGFVADLPRSRADLILENALLRQQLIILRCQIKRPQLKNRDRLILVIFAQLTHFWKQTLLIIQPDTLLHWHREMFRWVWWFKSCVPFRQSKVASEII
jgi:putative transposase